MREIEVKFRVARLDAVRSQLKKLGGRLLWRGIEENYFFDTLQRAFKKRKEFLRLRHDSRGNALTFKGRPAAGRGRYKERMEHETEVKDFVETRTILAAMGFKEIFRYKKYREHWKLHGVFVELDRVAKKQFVEVEGSKDDINKYAKKLGLEWQSATTQSYPDILKKLKHER